MIPTTRFKFATQAPQRGFTLLEILVAAAISVVIGTMAVMALQGASDTATRSVEIMATTNKLDRAWQVMETDLRHLLRPDGRHSRFEAKTLQFSGANSTQVVMQFKRTNWVNFAQQPRSDLQMVSYRIVQGKLIRDFVPDINRDISEIDFERDGMQVELLDNIEAFDLKFLSRGMLQSNGESQLSGSDYTRNWLPMWPDSGQPDVAQLPLAMEVRITLKGEGESVRLFTFAN